MADLTFPPEEDFGSIVWNTYVAPTVYPSYLVPVADPIHGAKITRIADESVFGVGDSQKLRHAYSRTAVWNSDGSKIQLFGQQGKMLDGKTFEIVATISNGFLWSNATPNKIFNSTPTGLNVSTINMTTYAVTRTQTRTFSGYASMSMNGDENNISDDDKYACLYGLKTGSTDCWVVIYNIQADTIVSQTNIGIDINDIDWISMSRTGNYVVMRCKVAGTAFDRGTFVFDRNMANKKKLTNNASHGDLGKDASGNDVYVSFGGTSGYGLTMIRLSNQVSTPLLPNNQTYVNRGIPGVHISCRNTKRDGWAYVTMNEHPDGPDARRPSLEIIAVKLDSSNIVERWCKTNSRNSRTKYYHQAQASVSPDGLQVCFASDWNIPSEESKTYAKAFVVKYIASSGYPIITRTDNNPKTIIQGGVYTPPTGTWTDEIDGNGIATIGGDTVNVNILGNYTVTLYHTNSINKTSRISIIYKIIAPTDPEPGDNINYPLTNAERKRGKQAIIQMIKQKTI